MNEKEKWVEFARACLARGTGLAAGSIYAAKARLTLTMLESTVRDRDAIPSLQEQNVRGYAISVAEWMVEAAVAGACLGSLDAPGVREKAALIRRAEKQAQKAIQKAIFEALPAATEAEPPLSAATR